MLRRTYLIITVTSALTTVQCGPTKAEARQQQQLQEQLNNELLFRHKFWIRDTEFVERDNWRNGLKPCTLFERIVMDEQSVVSMGDSMDAIGGALESNIRDFALAMDGVLLMEEDTFGDDPLDRMFVQYLSEHSECVSSAKLSDQQMATDDGNDNHKFEFKPDSDLMSWFNPDNWISAIDMDDELNNWLPESHRIPCSGDVVSFGQRDADLWPTIEANERSKTLSFKVNFRPSKWKDITTNFTIDNLRVAKLKIGDQSYNQQEFNQLISSDFYENLLFEFNGKSSILSSEDGLFDQTHSSLVIDESSFQPDEPEFCMNEAGCLCENENAKVMEAICSFHYPLEEDNQPCRDPISSAGYCNKICATSIVVSMDPTKFIEQFAIDTLTKIHQSNPDYFDTVLVIYRRISDNRYEITSRLLSNHIGATYTGFEPDYESVLGREQEFARLVFEKLNNPATKSFYGIKSINIKSSVDWRLNNRAFIFYISFCVLTFANITILICQDQSNVLHTILNHGHIDSPTGNWFFRTLNNMSRRSNADRALNEIDELDPCARCYDPNMTHDSDNGSLSEIALVMLKSTKTEDNQLDSTES